MFCHIHTHSVNSIRDGMIKIPELVKRSIEFNEAFALTDHGNIAGWIEYSDVAKKNNIKPIFGCEIYINQYREELLRLVREINSKGEEDKDKVKQMGIRRDELKKNQRHLVLIAKNETGFYNIIKLINEAYVDFFYSKPLADYKSLFSMNKDKDGSCGIIVSTACLASPLNSFLEVNHKQEAIDWIKTMKEHFGDDFYLEVQANNIPEQVELNKFIIQLAKETKTKIVIGSDSHYLDDDDADTHQDLLLLQNKNSRSDLDKKDFRVTWENKNGEIKTKKVKPEKEFRKGHPVTELEKGMKIGKDIIISVEEVSRAWIFSTDRLSFKKFDSIKEDIQKYHKELVPFIDDIFKNNSEIYDKVENIDFNRDIKLPKIEDASKIFRDIVKKKLKEKLAMEANSIEETGNQPDMKAITRKYLDRIKYELDIIEQFGFETYFLILYDVLEWARQNDIAIGAGRGSVAGSMVAYVLDLHRINPFDHRWDLEKVGLPFERFLDFGKLFNKIILTNDEGKTMEFLENSDVDVMRDSKIITIKAIELKEGDEVVI